MFIPLSSLNLNLLNAIGRSDIFLKIDFAKIPLIFITMAITFPISLRAVVMGKALTAFIYFYMNAFMIGRLYGFGAFKQIVCIWKAIVSTIVMAILLYILCLFCKNSFICLILGIISGVLVYFLCLLLLKEEELYMILRKIKFIRTKEKK